MKKWWRRRSLRARLMVIGIAGLCLGFLLGGVTLLAALGWVLQRSVDAEAGRTARDVGALVDAGTLPQPVPVAGSDVVQVVDAQGRVRSASLGADRLTPIVARDRLAGVRDGEAFFIRGDMVGLPEPVRVVTVRAGPASDPQTVIVARSLADVMRGIHVLQTTLLIVFPVLIAVLAAVAWRVIGATLRPVEALRRGAAEITGASTGAGRLPVPAGHDEISRLAMTLNDMLARLEGGRARQREFVADAAHELRSPLANMRTQLEVAQHMGGSTDWPTVAADVLTDANRLARLVDDLLILARSDESAELTRAEPVELVSLVREVSARYQAVTVAAGQDPVWTVGERDALVRIVGNLLDNAVRHARTAVVVAVVRGPAITVTDDGPGIPEADLTRVFDRFTRLDDGRARDDGGAGLGLAIVRELVRRHGGTVTLANMHPGLCATVTLPPAPAEPR